MSLKVWLPLNGDLHNQGISGDNFIINTNPVYINNGKIGKAMSTGQITMPAVTAASILNNNAFSFACWIYVNAATGDTSNRAMLFGNGGMTPPNNRKFSIFQYPTCNDLHLSWQNDASGTFCGGVWAGSFPSYEWTHVAITYQNPVGTIYINGVKKANFNGVSNSTSFEYDTCLFANIPNGSRYLNDYRIYDHCLSVKEVKEISQGLVLHYKLNLPSPNLLNNSLPHLNTLTGWSYAGSGWSNQLIQYGSEQVVRSTYTGTTQTSGGIHHPVRDISELIDGETYTFSGWVRASKACTVTFSNELMTIRTPIHVTTQWQFFTSTSIIDTSKTYKSNVCYVAAADVEQNMWIEAKQWKFEQTTMPTAWIPSTTDTIYNLYQNNNITDVSGYNHNGTIINTITTSSDTPRYNSSANLINGNSAINCGRDGMVTDSITVNLWIKASAWANPVSCTEGGGWNFESSGDYFRFPVYISGVGYKYGVSSTTRAQICNNQWHMLTGVYDRSNGHIKIYVDSKLDNDYDADTTNIIGYNSSNVIWLGAEASGSATAFASKGMMGLFSDFRIYCTALSAEDIKELYQVSASIDKLGNIHTYDFNEDDLNNISNTGILHNTQLNESNFSKYLKYDPNVYIEPDGSCWLHIYHHNNPSLGSFASTNDFEHGVYIDDNRWFNVNVCNYLDKWELMVKGKFTNTSDEWKIRWIQSVNPMVATFAQVAVANVTKITANGYLSSPNNWGGLYAKKGNTYLSANNGTNGNWWGAVGSYSIYQGGIPGWGYQGNSSITTTGFNDLYVRIDNVDFDNINNASNNKNKIWTANQFIEK